MIKGYYVQVLKCPPEEEWWGEDGAVWTAVEALNVADYRTVESVFASLLEDPALDVSQRRSGPGGHNAKIKLGTTECDVLMGASKAGAGQRWTASMISENSDVDVVHSTVGRTMGRLEALTTKRGSQKTGSRDIESPWATARLAICLQPRGQLKEEPGSAQRAPGAGKPRHALHAAATCSRMRPPPWRNRC